jgi:hypothetical protein
MFDSLRHSILLCFCRSGLLAVVCAGWLTGCQPYDPVPPPAPADAQAALKDFLEAWKAGGTSQELTSRTPPVRGMEPEWTANAKLLEYTIDPDGNAFGNSHTLRTKLKLQRPGSRQTQQLHVQYIISTPVTEGDPVTIVRE